MTNEPAPTALDSYQQLRQSWPATHRTFGMGDKVRKVRGSQWHGRVVGWYSTELTPEGYAVESNTERGSVQIYPASALERAAQA
jgi:dihydrofolate reductase (trimethoprim resistance protein)